MLEPLDPGSVTEMLDGLVPGLPRELVADIVRRAEGIPLYAVETIRMLLDRGLVVQDGDRYVVTGDVSDLDVPETLQALLASRLDGLQAVERFALQNAAVLGRSFTAAGVAALTGRPEGEVAGILDGLVAKQVLSRDDDPRSPDRGQYVFLQELLRTVTYGTLARRTRKKRHVAAAQHLEQAWPGGREEIAEVLAAHYLEAIRADPDAGRRDGAAGVGARGADRGGPCGGGTRARSRGAGVLRAGRGARRRRSRARRAVRAGRCGAATQRRRRRRRAGAAPRDRALPARRQAVGRLGRGGPGVLAEGSRAAGGGARAGGAVSDARRPRRGQDRPGGGARRARHRAHLRRRSGRGGGTAARRGADDTRAGTRVAGPRHGPHRAGHPPVDAPPRSWRATRSCAWRCRSPSEHDLPAVALRARYNLAGLALDQDRLADTIREVDAGLVLARERGDRFNERILLAQSLVPLVVLGRWDEAAPIGEALISGELDILASMPRPACAQIAAARGDDDTLDRCRAIAERDCGFHAQRCTRHRDAARRARRARARRVARGARPRPAGPRPAVLAG